MIGASLLVAGTTIGAGMLALPTVTGLAGWLPTTLLFVFYWVFMTFTAFLILEVTLWMEPRANMISMAKKTLGPVGEVIAWVAYLFLLYGLMTAYLAGSGPLVVGLIARFMGFQVPEYVGFIPLLLIFGYFVMLGAKSVDRVNRLLMAGMGLTFVILIVFLLPHMQIERLLHLDFTAVPLAVSVAATSFGFHIVIPSLSHYLEGDVVKIRQALWLGSFIPLLIYLIWEGVALGVIPITGPFGIEEGLMRGASGAELLLGLIHNSALALVTQIFALLAIITSFLGVSLSLSSCIADGLHLRQVKAPSGLVDLLTFVPPLAIALINPNAFLLALEFAGVFGVIFLLAALPACMVWSGRYLKKFKGDYRAPGGKGALMLTLATALFLLILEGLSWVKT